MGTVVLILSIIVTGGILKVVNTYTKGNKGSFFTRAFLIWLFVLFVLCGCAAKMGLL